MDWHQSTIYLIDLALSFAVRGLSVHRNADCAFLRHDKPVGFDILRRRVQASRRWDLPFIHTLLPLSSLKVIG